MKKKSIFFILMSLVVMLMSTTAVYAGSINGAEASIIAAARGSFEYNGKIYVATGSSLGQLYAYLSSDDVDLTDEQASRAIGMMYENISTGVEGGYIVPIADEPSSEEGDDSHNKTDNNKTDNNKNNPPDSDKKDKTESNKDSENDSENTDSDYVNQVEPIIPDELSPEAKDLLDEFFQINQNVGGEGIEQVIERPEKEEESPIDNNDIPVAVWIAAVIGLLAIAAVLVIVLKTPNLKGMKALAIGQKDELRFTNIHCHALYGLDDGAKSLEQSRAMLEMMKTEGVVNVIFSFHAGTRSSGKRINKAKEHMEQLKQEYPEMGLYLGNEILNGSHMQKALVEERILTLAGSRYVMVEFLPQTSYDEIFQRVRHLVNGGYSPIIAHAERYSCLIGSREKVQNLVNMGAYIQINSRSFVGNMVDKRSRFAIELLRSGLVHFVADDCHSDTGRKPLMGSVYMYLLKRKGINKDALDRVFRNNPAKVLDDQSI